MEHRKRRIVSACVKESSDKNNQKEKKSGFGPLHTTIVCGKRNTEQNLLKVDIDPITLETAQDKVIFIEKDSTKS